MSYDVRLQQVDSIPIVVIRRQVRAADLSRVVPECCGLVWNALRAQQAKGGRHVALYWDGSIRLEVGAELLGRFTEQGDVVRSATPAGTVVSVAHFGPYGSYTVTISATTTATGITPPAPVTIALMVK
jgi:hypothetical protein